MFAGIDHYTWNYFIFYQQTLVNKLEELSVQEKGGGRGSRVLF